MVKNYLSNWTATIKLLLRRTLVLHQFYSIIIAIARQSEAKDSRILLSSFKTT